tara:strand:+ start:3207 stop:4304 length:1098 start_codon:yes stop_codon:yes gene_type:complete
MVGITKFGDDGAENAIREAHGVQSIGITTNFNLEQAFELGQIQIYENIEGLPDVEVTMEKVIDGYPLLYHLCTSGATNSSLTARSKARADIRLGIYSDDEDFASGAPDVEVVCSGMYMSSVSYTIPVDGNATESVTLVGNHKNWLTNGHAAMRLSGIHTDEILGVDVPAAYTAQEGGVQRRENVVMESSIFPATLQGINSVGSSTGGGLNGNNVSSGVATNAHVTSGSPLVHIQNVSISTDFSREDILELGRKTPYFRAPGFPIEVSCEIEAISTSGDFVNALETGDPANDGTSAAGDNITNDSIKIVLQDNTQFDLGTANKLSSVSYGGGDATGGNVSSSYSYQNFNVLNVSSPYDPSFVVYPS